MQKIFSSKIFIGIVFLVVIAGVFEGGFYFGKSQKVCQTCAPEKVNFSLFWQAWDMLHQKYVHPENINDQNLIYGAISGMVNSLNDPYTVFFNPKDSKSFMDQISGSFGGIGAEIGIKDQQLQVISPLEGTPAKAAGLKAGDQIIKIGDKSTTGMTVDDAVSIIRGPSGTEVVLTIMRDGWEAAKEITIKRAVINVPSLKLTINGDVADLQIFEFSETLSNDFTKAALQIIQSPAKKIVIDLRGNPGGYLEVAQYIAGWFLDNGKTVVTEDFNNKQPQNIYKAQGNAKFANYPVVIIIDKGSASASEILAAALRDNRGIKLIGEKSYGKGSVQEVQDLSNGSSMKITVADWLTPKGAHITGVGLEPDVKISITDADIKDGKDPQLDKALEIIKAMK